MTQCLTIPANGFTVDPATAKSVAGICTPSNYRRSNRASLPVSGFSYGRAFGATSCGPFPVGGSANSVRPITRDLHLRGRFISRLQEVIMSTILSISDINTQINGQPRMLDIRLAEALGFSRPRKIRDVISRHLEALERLGEVVCPTSVQTPKGGRPGKEYWLTKKQALYLCTKSETANATEVTIQMVEVFDAVTNGKMPPSVETMVQSIKAGSRLTDAYSFLDNALEALQQGDVAWFYFYIEMSKRLIDAERACQTRPITLHYLRSLIEQDRAPTKKIGAGK